jgi:hypothetical protein
MVYQSTTMFLLGSRWFLGSLQFITAKFGDLTLQEPEWHKIVRSGTGRLPPATVQVSLVNEEQLRQWLNELGRQARIPRGIKLITPWLFQQPQQIQSTSHHRSLTLREVEKSTWWGMERNSRIRWSRRSSRRLKRKSIMQGQICSLNMQSNLKLTWFKPLKTAGTDMSDLGADMSGHQKFWVEKK